MGKCYSSKKILHFDSMFLSLNEFSKENNLTSTTKLPCRRLMFVKEDRFFTHLKLELEEHSLIFYKFQFLDALCSFKSLYYNIHSYLI